MHSIHISIHRSRNFHPCIRTFCCKIESVVACVQCALIINFVRTPECTYAFGSQCEHNLCNVHCNTVQRCVYIFHTFHRCVSTYTCMRGWFGVWRVWIRYVDELRSMDDAINHGFLNATIVWPGLHFGCVCKLHNVCVYAGLPAYDWFVNCPLAIAMHNFQLSFQLGRFNFGCRRAHHA